MAHHRRSLASALGRGVIAGLAGTAVMTAFQKAVEMPLTQRADSYAPADFAERVTPIRAGGGEARRNLNYATHFGLSTLWGGAYGMAAFAGLKGARAVAAVFATVYTGDLVLNTALGLYRPWDWSRQDWAIDIVDKLVQAAATGVIYEVILDRPGG